MSYLSNVGVATTHLINAVLAGSPLESTSSRAWRNRHKPLWGVLRRVVDAIFDAFGFPDHCLHANLAYQARVKEEQR